MPMASPCENDLVAFLAIAAKSDLPEIELDQLGLGDRMLVRTRNTAYLFVMTGPREAMLVSDRVDRPSGPVQIRGCVFGQSSIIKPGHLFCGGGLEIVAAGGAVTHTTTLIEALQLVKVSGVSQLPDAPA